MAVVRGTLRDCTPRKRHPEAQGNYDKEVLVVFLISKQQSKVLLSAQSDLRNCSFCLSRPSQDGWKIDPQF